MPRKGTIEWYREAEKVNTQLRSHLLKNIKKLPTETSHDWLNRVNRMYQKEKIKY